MYDSQTGDRIQSNVGEYPVVEGDTVYFSGKKITAAFLNSENVLDTLWQIDVPATKELIKAGNCLYATDSLSLTAIDIAGGKPRVLWSLKSEKTIERLVASNGKLIAVTAMTASRAGEGKTVTTIGLSQAFQKIGKSVMFALREPSMGPTFGIKGGATGGHLSQVFPMWDINLHFTGDLHAITSAHNLLAALLDNHLTKGNKCNIDPTKVTWPRTIDMNDRALRNIITGLGGRRMGGDVRNTGFVITAASEIMAILALSADVGELKERLGSILLGYTYDDKPVFARDIEAVGAMTLILKDAIKPNLVQNFEGVPGFIHCGPFANIAHGNSSIIGTKLAMKLADYTITEGGFAADLGFEKFVDIVARQYDTLPNAVVLVVTARALKLHGGIKDLDEAMNLHMEELAKGFENVEKHLDNMLNVFNIPPVVA
ncbi:MAG: formate--tetrahydrofolate ligase, partial [Candidatus Heimdallarchaeota archaeon]|nr:formate--tetrahydrofolate ligase [Candidatus Heimdallarchaeota archaeon]